MHASTKTVCAAVVATCVLLGGAPAAARPLVAAIEQALRTDPELAASTKRRLATDEEVLQARAGLLPRVDLNLAVGRQQLDSPTTRVLGLGDVTGSRRIAGISLNQPLYDGGTRAEIRRQQARVEGAQERVLATRDDVAARTAAVYLEVLRRRESVDIATANVDAHRRLLDTIRSRTESGVGRRADQDLADGRLALAQANLLQERNALRDAEAQYLRVVGEPAGALERPRRLPEPASEAAAREQAQRGNPALRAVRADVEAARAQADGALAPRQPRLELEVARNHDRLTVLGPTDDTSALLRLRYNLYRGGADEARVRQTRLLADEALDQVERARRQLDEQISQAYTDLVLGQERNEALRRHVAASAATREAYVAQFSIGQRSLLDLLNAENEFFNARLNVLTGELLELNALYRLQAVTGNLLSTLGIDVEPRP